jgi:hypothetical protein
MRAGIIRESTHVNALNSLGHSESLELIKLIILILSILGIKNPGTSDTAVWLFGALLIFWFMFMLSLSSVDRLDKMLFGSNEVTDEGTSNPETKNPRKGNLSCLFLAVVILIEIYLSLVISSHMLN